MKEQSLYIKPNWPLNEVVVAGTTLSLSNTAREGFNLAQHVEDTPAHVSANRDALLASFEKKVTPMWLSQCHSNKVIRVEDYKCPAKADAGISYVDKFMPVVLTADCLPILLSDINGQCVAAIHAGWRGLYNAIIANTIANMPLSGKSLYAWIGPAIMQNNYEVDESFFQRFIKLNADFNAFFINNRPNHYLVDLSAIASYQLQACGLLSKHIYFSHICSYEDKRFFSYRRDGHSSGRMASFIFTR